MQMTLSIVIPVYNSKKTLGDLVYQIQEIYPNVDTEIILVDDGSSDSSIEIIKHLAAIDKRIVCLSFRKNFGQANAILAGLRQARGNYAVVMDADLQYSPKDISNLVNQLKAGRDFVFGVPSQSKRSSLRDLASYIVRKTAHWFYRQPKELKPTSFIGLTKSLAKEISDYNGPYPYIAGLIIRLSHNGCNVKVANIENEKGKSNYTFSKLLGLWLSGLTGFSIIPLRVASLIGFFLSLTGFIVLIVIVISQLFFTQFLSGWVSILGSVLVFSGVQLLAVGLLGEYVGRIFMQLNKTPQYSIREKINDGI